ncbi:MAG TPA: hypothetical protein VFA81_11885 [Burkholderiales bacterium]|nr:hypothetical protein [Burkholderiales bacterium]
MGTISQISAAAAAKRDGDSYSEAAAEAFNSSAAVQLALQLPDVNLQLIASMFKAGFAAGSMYGYREGAAVFEKVITEFASGQKH